MCVCVFVCMCVCVCVCVFVCVGEGGKAAGRGVIMDRSLIVGGRGYKTIGGQIKFYPPPPTHTHKKGGGGLAI